MSDINVNDPKFRRWSFYYNPDDPRFFIRVYPYAWSFKRYYEFNYAHPISYILSGLICVGVIVMIYVTFPVWSHSNLFRWIARSFGYNVH